jgi:hypothetical protein
MTDPEQGDRSGTPMRGPIAIAGAIVAAGVVAGLVVGGAFERASPSSSATPSPAAVAHSRTANPTPTPIVVMTATPKPSPTPVPTPAPTFTIPTPAPDGIPPPLPPIEIAGADPAVIEAIGSGIDRLEMLDAYRFTTNVSGRGLTDLSSSGIDLGMDGSLTNRPSAALDVTWGFRMVEFECSAATSSSSRLVIVDGDAWSSDDGQLEPVPGDATTIRLLTLLTPAGVARRVLVPFAGGFAEIGSEVHEGVDATLYRATGPGVDAYSAVTGIDGDWTADVWIAESGHLQAVSIEGRGPGPCDGFLALINVTDVNDPGIVIARPS